LNGSDVAAAVDVAEPGLKSAQFYIISQLAIPFTTPQPTNRSRTNRRNYTLTSVIICVDLHINTTHLYNQSEHTTYNSYFSFLAK